ncbi:MAG: hydroxymethylbilane synthase [Alphaproteobacteria bacterium]
MSPNSYQITSSKIKIGTRSSALALTQAYYIRDCLKIIGNLTDNDFEIIPIKTTGDKLLTTKLQDLGGKGLFTKEIEQALLNKTIDIAVHSGKDVPTQRQAGLYIMATPEREDCRDAYISYQYPLLSDLPQGATLGTASLRRTAQFLYQRPDLTIVLLRGNVQTRLQKLSDGVCDATILACAGLNRLKMPHIATQILDIDDFLPAPAQGALMIEGHLEMPQNLKLLINQLNCQDTFDTVTAERALLSALDGDCRTPIAAFAKIDGDTIILQGALLSDDGTKKTHKVTSGLRKNSYELGLELGNQIKEAFYKC